MNIFKNIAQTWNEYRQRWAAYAELTAMSDRDLRDMGLYRGDIARVVFDVADVRPGPGSASAQQDRPAPVKVVWRRGDSALAR